MVCALIEPRDGPYFEEKWLDVVGLPQPARVGRRVQFRRDAGPGFHL